MRRTAESSASPRRHRAQTAKARAVAVTGQASYRVRQASANTQPTTVSRRVRAPNAASILSVDSISNATPSSVSASSSGSVIGVDCRYNTFGLAAKTVAATTAATRDSVSADTIHAIAPAATANERIERATADAPVR